jgi:hypothetical protein
MARTRNLGNLTDLFTAGSTYASTATPPQFDNSTNVATTAWVKSSGLQLATNVGISTNSTLTVAQAAGAICNIQGTGLTVTMPLTSTAVIGTRIEFTSGGAGNVVQRQGSDTFSANYSNSLNSITLNSGDNAVFVYMGSSQWYLTGGTVQLGSSAGFGASLLSAGYQKFPSGLIIQWGTFSGSSSADTAVTFPLAFPTAAQNVVVNAYTSAGAGNFATTTGVLTTTGFSGSVWSTASTRINSVGTWIATGR